MRVRDTAIEGVKLIQPEVFEDHRGVYVELFDTEKYRAVCGDLEFVQDDVSVSRKHVLRGLHGDFETTKLVSVLHGTGYALLADNREGSPTFKSWQAFTLDDRSRCQLLIPPGIGNSVVALSDVLVYWYKQTTHFVPGRQFTIRWDDPDWEFSWPIAKPILSARDELGRYVDAAAEADPAAP
ncbi:MAG TPA: dTDP-4-dehydrorhamnose 3,5-epimerase family protein [Planctomycetota bacterium]|nr:dTDP-4-dehydrorhamnose 3,5-epimerase family protein [Planctomycetota bacterium]